MPEKYLTLDQIAERLQVSRQTVVRRLPAMKANGLKVVKIGQLVRVIESTFEKAIAKAAAREKPLV